MSRPPQPQAPPLRESRIGLSAQRFALIFSQPFRFMRRRVNRWIATRTPRVPGPWLINRRRVYILPTRYGYGYALLLLVMLLGAMNYSNSMAFALTFLLAGLGLIGMHHTHGNLVNVEVRAARAKPVFAGETAHFSIELANGSGAQRYALNASWENESAPAANPQPACIDLLAGQALSVALPLPAARRGRLAAPRFAVYTEFPLGLFHAWTWVELDMHCLIYPQPARRGERKIEGAGGQGTRSGPRRGQEEFAGLRSYQRGDSSRSIHWKSFARQRTLMTKQFAETRENMLWFDWFELPPQWDIERRLSELTRWIVDAESQGLVYGMRLPERTFTPASGPAHRHDCLQALALFAGARPGPADGPGHV